MKKLSRWMAVFVLGMLIGASITNVLIGTQIDNLHISNQALQQQLSVSERELQSLIESQARAKRNQVVTSIRSSVEFKGGKITQFEESAARLMVEKQVDKWLEVIEGQEIDDLDYELIPEIINNRIIEVDGQKMVLKVKMVIVSQTVVVYLEASLVSEEQRIEL